jgi:hypothetical protein
VKLPNKIVGRERRERVSQLTRCGEGALIRAAASTPTFDDLSRSNRDGFQSSNNSHSRYSFFYVPRNYGATATNR